MWAFISDKAELEAKLSLRVRIISLDARKFWGQVITKLKFIYIDITSSQDGINKKKNGIQHCWLVLLTQTIVICLKIHKDP